MTPAVLETLQRRRRLYPTPIPNDRLGELLNDVAWIHRAEGIGLFKKTSGAHTVQPRTGIKVSRDYLVWPNGEGFDVLTDAEGAAKPQMGRAHTMDMSRFVPAVDPMLAGEPPISEPQTPDVQPPPVARPKPPYIESQSVEFGRACNRVYQVSGAAFDPGMIAVHMRRCAYDEYVGGMSFEESFQKHMNAFRAEYRLPPV